MEGIALCRSIDTPSVRVMCGFICTMQSGGVGLPRVTKPLVCVKFSASNLEQLGNIGLIPVENIPS